MSRCRQCNIEILDETERCPLCDSVLEQTDEVENMYPNVRILTRKWMTVSRIYLFCAILSEAVFLYINAATLSKVWWSAVTGLGLFYVYLLIRFAILGKSGYKAKITVLVIMAILVVIAIDVVTGYRGWSVNYVLPSGILLIDAGILLLMICNRRNWQSYMMWQIFTVLCSFFALILLWTGIITSSALVLPALAASVFLFLGTVIIGDRRARVELKRRFHI